MTKIKHTPLPYSYSGPHNINGNTDTWELNYGTDGECVAEIVHGEENAKFLKLACNSHYDLIAALEEAQKTLAMMIAHDAIKQTTVLNAYAAAVEAEYKARQALSKAKGDYNETDTRTDTKCLAHRLAYQKK